MLSFEFNDVLSVLTHVRGGVPVSRLSSRIRLGEHRSLFFGPSNDFYDIQEYDPERDNSAMIIDYLSEDGIIYARRCIEPHEVKINFLVDLSSSVDAGFNLIKRRLLLEAIGFIGVTAARYQDPVGLVGFTDKAILNMRPRCGVNNFHYLLKNVYDFLAKHDPEKESQRKTDFFAMLDFVRMTFDKPCFIPIISDFIGFEKVLFSPLLRYVASRHELIFIFLDDPSEFTSIGNVGYVRMENVETGEQVTVSRNKLTQIEKEIRKKRKELRRELKRMGIYSVVLEYGQGGRHFNRLYRFFLIRHKQMNSRA